MKTLKLLSVIAVLGSASYLFGQENSPASKENSLYAKALFASIAEMQKGYGSQRDAPDYHHMFVSADPAITDHMPTQSGDYHVEYLNNEAQIAQYQKLKTEFPLLKIFPLENEGPKLKIGINVYYFSYKKRHFNYGLSDWSNVEFRFDCEKQEFTISSVTLGGI